MKKTVYILVGVAAVMFFWYHAEASMDSKKLSDIQLANVEALVHDESEAKACYETITSKDGCQVRYCPTCTFVPGTDVIYAKEKTCKK